MCRLVAGTLVGDAALLERTIAASRVHSNGWGAAWWTDHQQGYVRSDRAAYEPESGFREVWADLLSEKNCTYVCHLRKKSLAPVSVTNSHPFLKEGWAFAHNGTFQEFESGSQTDSEAFFDKEIVPGLRNGDDPVEVLRRAVGRLGEEYTAANIVLTNGRFLYALEAHRIKPEYYTLHWHVDRGLVCVASSDVAPPSWKALGNGNVLVVRDGSVEVVSMNSNGRRITA